jgi:hypothetical protein
MPPRELASLCPAGFTVRFTLILATRLELAMTARSLSSSRVINESKARYEKSQEKTTMRYESAGNGEIIYSA